MSTVLPFLILPALAAVVVGIVLIRKRGDRVRFEHERSSRLLEAAADPDAAWDAVVTRRSEARRVRLRVGSGR